MMSLVWSKYEGKVLCTYQITKHKEILEQKESLVCTAIAFDYVTRLARKSFTCALNQLTKHYKTQTLPSQLMMLYTYLSSFLQARKYTKAESK